MHFVLKKIDELEGADPIIPTGPDLAQFLPSPAGLVQYRMPLARSSTRIT
jgi:hypothetical protein